MKEREPRRKVFLPARIRAGSQWSDVRVLDVSSGGFLMQATEPPQPGMYVELRRGQAMFVARVVWAHNQRFGVRTRDKVSIGAFMEAASVPAPTAAEADTGKPEVVERRRESRGDAHERSRQVGRLIEQLAVLAAGIGGVVLVVSLMSDAFGRPLAQVASVLG